MKLAKVVSKYVKISYVILSLTILLLFNYKRIYLSYYSLYWIEKDAVIKKESRDFSVQSIKFTSSCKCRQAENVYVNKLENSYSIKVSQNVSSEPMREYNMSIDHFESSIMTCNSYSVLKRGLNTKVISYSLYGRNKMYYYLVKELVKASLIYYPTWAIRIYYDSSIDESIICEIECMSGNVDFCNVEKIPYDFFKSWNASYMHGIFNLHYSKTSNLVSNKNLNKV